MKKLLLLFCTPLLCLFSHGQYTDNHSYFPIAVWLQNPENAKQYKEDGNINLYIGLWNELEENQLMLMKEAGMKLICEQNDFGLAHKSDPAIIGWMKGDEPDNAQWNNKTKTYDPCISPDKVIAQYNHAREKDPDHPYYLNLGQGVTFTNWIGRGECRGRTDMYPVANNGYLKGCDIASFDIYPVNSKDTLVRDKLWMGAKGIDSLRVWSDGSKPVWTWIETTLIDKDSPRKPTPQEVKTQVWMALVHGAKGIGYFCHSFYPKQDDAALLHDKEMMSAVKEINAQITSLAPVLNSTTVLDFARVTSSNPQVPVDIMTKKQDADHYLFAVGMRNQSTRGSFKISAGNQVEVVGENRKLEIKDGRFEDHFNGFEVHIYKIR